MTLGDVSRTRRLAGNPSTSNVSDADITQNLAYATSLVYAGSGKDDWEVDTTNSLYPLAVATAELFAASISRDRFDDKTDVSTEIFKRAQELMKLLAASLASSAKAGVETALGSYKSWPLNSNAVVYRSMLSAGQTLIGVEGSYTDNQP